MKSLLLGAVAVLALSSAAHASIIPSLDSVTAEGSDFRFNYSAQLAPDQGVTAGSSVVIVDFAGYVPGSVLSTLPNVSASVSNTLPGNLLLTPGFVDNAAIPDLVFTYNGPDFQTSGGPFVSLTTLAGLSALSIYGDSDFGAFSAVAVRNAGTTTGTLAYNVGQVSVPSPAPEPGTWALFLTGFTGLGIMLRRRRTAPIRCA